MEIKEFQEKLASLCQEAVANGKRLKGSQVKEFFSGLELDKDQLVLVFRYLKSQGIQIEGFEEDAKAEEEKPAAGQKSEEDKENPCLTEEDKEYLKNYLEEVRDIHTEDERLARYMPVAAQYAADLMKDGMILADLIQEANVGLLMLLAENGPETKEEEIHALLRKAVKQAVDAEDEQNFEDDCLVAKVQNLDSVMKELTDGDNGEPKFSVEELAIMLDMDIDEMKDIIRLTGDYQKYVIKIKGQSYRLILIF